MTPPPDKEGSAGTIAVVIPTHRRRAMLPRLLDALLAEPVDELIVVPNGEPDGSLDLLSERAAGDPRLIAFEADERGKQPALRAGVEAAKTDLVLLLDDDVVPAPGLVRGHLEAHAGADNRVVVGYMPVAMPESSDPGRVTADLYSRAYEQNCQNFENDPDGILTALWGGNVSLGREHWLRVNPDHNDPLLNTYHEDREFGLLCEEGGMTGHFDRRLLAEHLYERSLEAFLADARKAGEARPVIHERHRDRIGEFDPDLFVSVAPYPGKLLVAGARRPRLRDLVIKPFLRAAIAAARALGQPRAETHAAYLLQTIEAQQGSLSLKPF